MIEFSRERGNTSNREIIAARISKHISLKKSLYVMIYIGHEIADLIGVKKGDYVNIMFHKNQKDIVLVKKSDANFAGSLKLHNPKQCKFLFVQYTIPHSYKYIMRATMSVNFDINGNGYIIVDLSRLRKK